MSNDTTSSTQLDIVPRRLELIPRPIRQLEQQFRTQHQRLSLAEHPYPSWTSYSTQRHVCDIALDTNRGEIWLATWGGVLCWNPETDTCIRHTSEHGLLGNAIHRLTVDSNSIIWAACQDRGLCSFDPNSDNPWQSHRDFERWKVLQIASRPDGGIYAALRDNKGKCALGEIRAPDSRLRLLVRGGLAVKEIEALLVDEDKTLWIGNAWGLHYYKHDGGVESLELEGKQVRALAPALGGGLWLGTNWGIYRCQPSKSPSLQQETDWSRDEAIALQVEPETGNLWAITAREVGRLVDNVWQPVCKSPPGRLNQLVTIPPNFSVHSAKTSFTEGQVLVGGANGLYQVGVDQTEAVLAGSSEDTLSNAIHCLGVDTAGVWVGTARGLYYFNGKTWKSYTADAPNLRDICAILPESNSQRLWVGSFQVGLQRLDQGVYIPERVLNPPIVSLTASPDGTLWAATLDSLYCRANDNPQGQPVTHSALPHTSKGIIQTICYQSARSTDDQPEDTIWVGTSSGLFRYRPTLDLLDWAQDFASGELEGLSIQALALDPLTNRLWIGTAIGLFSEHQWQRHREVDVRSLAFAPDGTFWLGTATGLEQWPAPEQGEWFAGEPTAQFTKANSGLAADTVTALAVGMQGDEYSLWVGSPGGVSCYRYPSQ